MIDIDKLTIGEAKQLAEFLLPMLDRHAALVAQPPFPLPLGSIVCVQTVTMWFVGTLKEVTGTDLVLMDAAWAAATGRFSEFVRTGEAVEVEPFPDGVPVVISRGAVVAVAPHPKRLRVVR